MSVALSSRDSSGWSSSFYPTEPLAERNNVELTRDMLLMILEYLSTVTASEFSGTPLRLVAHGGACMLLHNGLHELANRKTAYHLSRGEQHLAAQRKSTRDVDYIHRAFVTESASRGLINGGERLKKCIELTARHFGLGQDWMNSDADVALPTSTDVNGTAYDPIYAESLKENNVQLYTVFTSSNRLLTVIQVPPFWAVALKLVRYVKYDPGDVLLLLLFGSVARGSHIPWTADTLEGWVRTNCSAMNWDNWDNQSLMGLRQKIVHAVAQISSIGPSILSQPANSNPPGSGVHEPSADGVSSSGPSPMNPYVKQSITGIPWAGPASDAKLATRDNLKESSSLVIPSDSPSNSQSSLGRSLPFFHSSSVDLKNNSRNSRREEKRQREREKILQRRLKYMLRADEPDDSDEELKSTDSESDDEEKFPAPVIPHVPFHSTSLPPKSLRSWESSVTNTNRFWTETHITQEPLDIDRSSSPDTTSFTQSYGMLQKSRSLTWAANQHQEPLPRRLLTSPLLEPPRRTM